MKPYVIRQWGDIKWILTSDKANNSYVLEYHYTIKDKESKNFGKPGSKPVGYYGTLPAALRGYLNAHVTNSEKHLDQALVDALLDCKQVLKEVEAAVDPLNLR